MIVALAEQLQMQTIPSKKQNRGVEMVPWGIKPQLWDSAERIELRRAEAMALCNGSIDPKQRKFKGNLSRSGSNNNEEEEEDYERNE